MINVFKVMPEYPHLSYARERRLGDGGGESRRNQVLNLILGWVEAARVRIKEQGTWETA